MDLIFRIIAYGFILFYIIVPVFIGFWVIVMSGMTFIYEIGDKYEKRKKN